jgi:hypothetical protein
MKLGDKVLVPDNVYGKTFVGWIRFINEETMRATVQVGLAYLEVPLAQLHPAPPHHSADCALAVNARHGCTCGA